MEIKIRKISELKKSEYNPRTISDKDRSNLKNSLKQFGWLSPIIINKHPGRDNIVISGHQRIDIAENDLKWDEAPTIEVDLDPVKEKALNLAMNKIGGEFNEDKLIDVLSQIDEGNEDLLSLTGFRTEEVNYLLGLREKDRENIFAKGSEDAFELQGNKYNIQEGDIVRLDQHTIICGDSTDPNVLSKLLQDNKVDLVVTSPPYNLDIKYGKYSDKKEYKEYMEMIKKVFSNAKDFMKKGRFLCVNVGREWGPINIPAKYDQLMEEVGYIFFRNIYWTKPLGAARGTITSRNPYPRYYIPKVQTELIEIYSTEEEPQLFDHLIAYKYGEDKKRRDEQIPKILLDKYAGNVWEMMTETTLGREHPAPFPVQLPYNCTRFFTFEKEIVLDPFLGSGTTIIAADQLNRKGFGIELDPDYVSLVIERFLMYKPNAKMEIIKSKNESK